MPSDTPPRLAERIQTLFREQIEEWLTERGLVVLGVASLVAVIWKIGQNVSSRPEVEYVLGLVIYSVVVSVASPLYVEGYWGADEIRNTLLGNVLVLIIAMLKYLALCSLLLYQDLGLCTTLHQRWKNR